MPLSVIDDNIWVIHDGRERFGGLCLGDYFRFNKSKWTNHSLGEGLKMDFLSFARREKNQSQTG